MRPAVALSLLGVSLLPGCALLEDAGRNICVSLAAPIERHREWSRNYGWAELAWGQVCAQGGGPYSEDYAAGFKDGFAEYLFRGGDGEPPLVAPLRYRRASYQTPQGYAAIGDWFAGYRQGAAAARASGAREWITGPSSLRAGVGAPSPPAGPVALPIEPPHGPDEKVSPNPAADLPVLPLPQPLPAPVPAKPAAPPVPIDRPKATLLRITPDPRKDLPLLLTPVRFGLPLGEAPALPPAAGPDDHAGPGPVQFGTPRARTGGPG